MSFSFSLIRVLLWYSSVILAENSLSLKFSLSYRSLISAWFYFIFAFCDFSIFSFYSKRFFNASISPSCYASNSSYFDLTLLTLFYEISVLTNFSFTFSERKLRMSSILANEEKRLRSATDMLISLRRVPILLLNLKAISSIFSCTRWELKSSCAIFSMLSAKGRCFAYPERYVNGRMLLLSGSLLDVLSRLLGRGSSVGCLMFRRGEISWICLWVLDRRYVEAETSFRDALLLSKSRRASLSLKKADLRSWTSFGR